MNRGGEEGEGEEGGDKKVDILLKRCLRFRAAVLVQKRG